VPDAWGFATRAIVDEDRASSFSCGRPELDDFFARHALANDRRGFGRVFVLGSPDGSSPRVRGFYTLSMGDMGRGDFAKALPRNDRQGLPRYPIPVAVIGRLAVHAAAQRQGIGETLLVDAFQRIIIAAEHTACAAVVVDAKDAGAERFYARYSFETLDPEADFPRRMLIPMATVRAATP
jgi:GNAT superfamily N-acetyltransferase